MNFSADAADGVVDLRLIEHFFMVIVKFGRPISRAVELRILAVFRAGADDPYRKVRQAGEEVIP